MSQRRNVKWLFVGSSVDDSKDEAVANKVKDRMPPADRRSHSSYLFKGQSVPPCQIDEYKMSRVFGPLYISYQRLMCQPEWSLGKESLTDALLGQFRARQDGSLVILSGPMRPGTGEFLVWHTSADGESVREALLPADVLGLWKRRVDQQRHLLLVVDCNYSEVWGRAAREAGDPTVSVLCSNRAAEKAAYDDKVGSYFLHNLYKVLAGFTGESVVEAPSCRQSPLFVGNAEEVEAVFGLKVDFQSVADLKAALSGTALNQRPVDFALVDPRDLGRTVETIHDVKCLPFMESRFGGGARTPRSRSPKTGPGTPKSAVKGASKAVEKLEFVDSWEGKVDGEGRKQGPGTLKSWKGEVKFTGRFVDDLKEGVGVEYRPGGTRAFEGHFSRNRRSGKGRQFDKQERVVFDGLFEEDVRNGEGREFWESGQVLFKGSYRGGQREGPGTEFRKDGSKRLEGNWSGNSLNGLGSEFDEEGNLVYEGEFKGGVREGRGKLFFEGGKMRIEGVFLRGELAGEGVVKDESGTVLNRGKLEQLKNTKGPKEETTPERKTSVPKGVVAKDSATPKNSVTKDSRPKNVFHELPLESKDLLPSDSPKPKVYFPDDKQPVSRAKDESKQSLRANSRSRDDHLPDDPTDAAKRSIQAKKTTPRKEEPGVGQSGVQIGEITIKDLVNKLLKEERSQDEQVARNEESGERPSEAPKTSRPVKVSAALPLVEEPSPAATQLAHPQIEIGKEGFPPVLSQLSSDFRNPDPSPIKLSIPREISQERKSSLKREKAESRLGKERPEGEEGALVKQPSLATPKVGDLDSL